MSLYSLYNFNSEVCFIPRTRPLAGLKGLVFVVAGVRTKRNNFEHIYS